MAGQQPGQGPNRNFLPAGYEDDEDLNELGAVGGAGGGGGGVGGWDDLDVEAYEARLLDLNGLQDFEGDYDDFDDFFYDEDDDDYDMWDSFDDIDSSEDDDEGDRYRVFRALQDSSGILPQISFYRTEPELYQQRGSQAEPIGRRWPKVRADAKGNAVPETYESLHRVLQELEVLLKGWKRRSSHPFTAHLKRRSGGKTELSNSWLEVLSGTDVESDDPEAAPPDGTSSVKPKKVSESLTKKKYCQSTRLYFDIFDQDGDMDQAIQMVRKMRKNVRNIAFSLFLECFEEESPFRKSLPVEVQEKIWLLTQEPGGTKPIFLSGQRFAPSSEDPQGLWLAEKERVTDLFAAAGNLHVIVFEFLFKQVRMPANEALWTTNDLLPGSSYPRVLFHKHLKLLRTAYQRFKALASIGESMSLHLDQRARFEQGVYSLDMQTTHRVDPPGVLEGRLGGFDPAVTFTVTPENEINPYLVQVGMDSQANSSNIVLGVHDAVRNQMVARIHTGTSYLSTDTSSETVTITGNTVSLLTKSEALQITKPGTPEVNPHVKTYPEILQLQNPSYEITSWTVPQQQQESSKDISSPPPMELTPSDGHIVRFSLPCVGALLQNYTDRRLRLNPLKVAIKTVNIPDEGGLVHLMHFSVRPFSMEGDGAEHYDAASSVVFVSARTGQFVDQMTWNNGEVSLHTVKSNLMVMWNGQDHKFLLVDINTRTEVAAVSSADVCMPDSCKRLNYGNWMYNFVFDALKQEFAVVCHKWMFKTYSYKTVKSSEGEDDEFVITPKSSGAVKELYGSVVSANCLYSESVLVGLQTRTPYYELGITSDIGVRRSYGDYCGSLMAIDLGGATSQARVGQMNPPPSEIPLVDVAPPTLKSVQKMNSFHRWIECEDLLTFSSLASFASRIEPDRMVFGLGQRRLLVLSLHQSESAALRKDCEVLDSRHQKHLEQKRHDHEKEKKLKAEAAERKVKDDARRALYKEATEKYVGSGAPLKGRVQSWKSKQGYGFVRPHGEAEPLGNIFLHISDVLNLSKGCYPCYNREVEFQVASDPGKTSHRAVKVTLLEMAPREEKEDKSGPAAGGSTSGAAAKGKSRNFRRGKRRPANKESSS